MSPKLLGINIDHVATIRNARGGKHPDIVRAAKITQEAGADILTFHLREDRRHIRDEDIFAIKENITIPINFEMAPTEEMVKIVTSYRPSSIVIVPEKREEITTEGGFDLIRNNIESEISKLKEIGSEISIFVNPDILQIERAKLIGADKVEIHTGPFSDSFPNFRSEFEKLERAVKFCVQNNIKCNLGHGLSYESVPHIKNFENISEVHIGHFVIGEAIFSGLENVIKKLKIMINS